MSDLMVTIPYVTFKGMEDELIMLREENQNYKQLLRYIYIKNDENIKDCIKYDFSEAHLDSISVDIDVVDFLTDSNLRQEATARMQKEPASEETDS